MKKVQYHILALISMLFVFNVRLNAQASQSLLWKISGNGLSSPSYLYGTIHLICKKDMMISEAFKKAFDSAEVVYMEVEPSVFDTSNRKKTLEQLRLVPSARDLLSTKDYRKLVIFAKEKLDMDEAAVSKTPLISLIGDVYGSMLHCDSIKSFEQYIIDRAESNHQSIRGIETVRDQIDAFNKVYLNNQSKQLMHVVNNYNRESKIYESFVESYKTQKLLKLFQGDQTTSHRNTIWIPKMISIMKGESTFFAFGAVHLPGKKGLISLLRDSGYNVDPIVLN